MKLNIANPSTGQQKKIDIEDSRVQQSLFDRRIAQDFDASILGADWAGYVLRITGGTDKQGFPMVQGVITNNRVSLLLREGSTGYHARRDGERKRKSVRGCIISPEISTVNVIVVKKGAKDIAGLTDHALPQRLGPKRASKIRKLFNLEKKDDVRKYVTVYARTLPKRTVNGTEEKYGRRKVPKIQRLVTDVTLQRQRRRKAALKKHRVHSAALAADYAKLIAQRKSAVAESRKALVSARRSTKKVDGEAKPAAAVKPKAKAAAPAAKPAAAAGAAPAKKAAAAATVKKSAAPAKAAAGKK